MSQRNRDRGGRTSHQPARSVGPNGWMGAGPYPPDLVPVALPGDYVKLVGLDEVREVEVMLAFPEVKALQDGVTVNANSTDSDNPLSELEQPTGWLSQFRMVQPGEDIDDGISVQVDYGGSEQPFYQTNNTLGEFENTTGTVEGYDESAGASFTSDDVMTQMFEFYVYGTSEAKKTPLFTFINSTAGPITVQDLTFSGYQYRMSAPTSAPDGYTPIPLPVRAPDRT